MTLQKRLPLLALPALLAGLGALPAAAATPSPMPVSAPCAQALAYERTAASDTVSTQGSYDAAIAGLEANKRCEDPAMSLTREAYLLSMRAGAERDLKIGDWHRDLTRANMLLTNCTNRPDIKKNVADDCRRQLRYNEEFLRRASVTPAPRPVGTPSAAMPAAGAPRPSTAPAGAGPRPVIAPPPTPPPSPRP